MRAYTISRRNEEYKVRCTIESVSAVATDEHNAILCGNEYEANVIARVLQGEGATPNVSLRAKNEWIVSCDTFAFFKGNADGRSYIRVCDIIPESWEVYAKKVDSEE